MRRIVDPEYSPAVAVPRKPSLSTVMVNMAFGSAERVTVVPPLIWIRPSA
ncbi:MAG: hypothetical protein ACTH5W_04660 [Providencia sp.]